MCGGGKVENFTRRMGGEGGEMTNIDQKMHLLDFLFEILYKTIKNIKTNEIFKGTVNVISSDPAFINYLIHPAFINCLIHNCKNQGYLIQSKD